MLDTFLAYWTISIAKVPACQLIDGEIKGYVLCHLQMSMKA